MDPLQGLWSHIVRQLSILVEQMKYSIQNSHINIVGVHELVDYNIKWLLLSRIRVDVSFYVMDQWSQWICRQTAKEITYYPKIHDPDPWDQIPRSISGSTHTSVYYMFFYAESRPYKYHWENSTSLMHHTIWETLPSQRNALRLGRVLCMVLDTRIP